MGSKRHKKVELVKGGFDPGGQPETRTGPDALNDLASGAIDCGFFDSGFAAAQGRSRR